MIGVLLTIAVVGFICWILMQIPMPPIFRNILYFVFVLGALIYLLNAFGVNTGVAFPK